jgi:hypothetical protein
LRPGTREKARRCDGNVRVEVVDLTGPIVQRL